MDTEVIRFRGQAGIQVIASAFRDGINSFSSLSMRTQGGIDFTTPRYEDYDPFIVAGGKPDFAVSAFLPNLWNGGVGIHLRLYADGDGTRGELEYRTDGPFKGRTRKAGREFCRGAWEAMQRVDPSLRTT